MFNINLLTGQRWLFTFVLLMGLSLKTAGLNATNHNSDVETDTVLDMPTGPVVLVVTGNIQSTNVDTSAHFDMSMIQDLPKQTIHTSTLVTDGIKRFDGVWVRDLLNILGPDEKVTIAAASALNDYVVNIPVTDFYDYDVLLATHMDGVQLQPSDKGPLWIVYPRDSLRKLQDIRYDYRWVWQLNHLDLR